MKKLFKTLPFALATLLCVFILGIAVPMIASLFIIITTDATLQECIQTVPFMLFSVLGNIGSAIYINDEIKPE